MDIAPEVLFGGIGLGFSGMAVGLRVIYSNLRTAFAGQIEAFESRITALEIALANAQRFERETLLGLLADAQIRETEHNRSDRRMARVIAHLRKRYGDGILAEIHDLNTETSDDDSDIKPQDPTLPPSRRPTPASGTRSILS